MRNPEKGDVDGAEVPTEMSISVGSDETSLVFQVHQAPIIDPTYEELRSKSDETARATTPREAYNSQTRDVDREGSFQLGDPEGEEADEFDEDGELAILVEHLKRTAPTSRIRPSFRASLRSDLLEVMKRRHVHKAATESLLLQCLAQQLHSKNW